jgi:hypothetical protein
VIPLRFTEAEAEAAYDEWGCNCGPSAIAAVCGLTLAELRPHMQDFEKKHYTNPSMMWKILTELGVKWRVEYSPACVHVPNWPLYGLARVQWEGPWTAPGVPPKAAYRYTHWIGVNSWYAPNIGIFDINAINSGGWIGLHDWETLCVPHILKSGYPKATGRWWLTHRVEVSCDSHGGILTRSKESVSSHARLV